MGPPRTFASPQNSGISSSGSGRVGTGAGGGAGAAAAATVAASQQWTSPPRACETSPFQCGEARAQTTPAYHHTTPSTTCSSGSSSAMSDSSSGVRIARTMADLRSMFSSVAGKPPTASQQTSTYVLRPFLHLQ